MKATCYHESHHPVLLWFWRPPGSQGNHGGDDDTLKRTLDYLYGNQGGNFKLDCQPRQYEIQRAVKQEAQSEDKFPAVALGKESAQALGQDVSNGKAAKDQTLLF